MFTHGYKGYFIHGYLDHKECNVSNSYGGSYGEFKSYRAAQLFITKRIKQEQQS